MKHKWSRGEGLGLRLGLDIETQMVLGGLVLRLRLGLDIETQMVPGGGVSVKVRVRY